MDNIQQTKTNRQSFIHSLKSICSFFIWGSGQAMNRQFGKALFFFLFFICFIGIELRTSHYFEDVSPYDKIIGKDFSETLASTFHQTYQFNVRTGETQRIAEYEEYYEEVTADGEFTNEELYTYIVQEMVAAGKDDSGNYILTPLAAEFRKYMTNVYNKPGNLYDSQDFTRFTIRLYFLANPEVRENFEESFYNFFYDRGGFFLRGFWGVITLGETFHLMISNHNEFKNLVPPGISLITRVRITGHESSRLLLQGLISTLIFLYFCIVWVWNVRDAYKTSKQIHREGKVPSQKEYFRSVYHDSFEYIVLFPAIFIVTMISIMPILFGFLVAFTSYSNVNPINLTLFDWVGFKNFFYVFRLTNVDLPWATVFRRVFTWTIVWAIFSTFTCYFAGFLQALVLNNKHVAGRKMWRSILILPWAVPAIISQMVLKIMFNDEGIVNSFFGLGYMTYYLI